MPRDLSKYMKGDEPFPGFSTQTLGELRFVQS